MSLLPSGEKFLKMVCEGDMSKIDFVIEEFERRIKPSEIKEVEDRLELVATRLRKLNASPISNKKKKPLVRAYVKEIHNLAEKLANMKCKYERDIEIDKVMDKFVMPSNSKMLDIFKKN